MPSRLSERPSARPPRPASPSLHVPIPLRTPARDSQAVKRRRRPTAVARVRGFTLVETAIAGIVMAGISGSLLMAFRYSQMIDQGKAVGEQLAIISEGAGRYMKQYGRRILALDPRCAEAALELDEGTSVPSSPGDAPPSCGLALGDVTVANGYHPTVEELRRLLLVRASDALLLPFSPGITRDKRTGEAALPRIAVWIRPVRNTTSASGSALAGSGHLALPSGAQAQLMQVSHPLANAPAPGGTPPNGPPIAFDAASRNGLNMPPTLFGVNCYNGLWQSRNNYVDGTPVFAELKNPRKVLPIYTAEQIAAARASGGVVARGEATEFWSGEQYCRYMQLTYGDGIFGATSSSPPPPGGNNGGNDGGNNGGSTQATSLESITFNTQPYFYGSGPLPMGASMQIGAALAETGFSGRLSTLKAPAAASRFMPGMYGQSTSDNPILSRDGLRGVPGILAAVRWVADSDTVVDGGGNGTGTDTGVTWDAVGNNFYNAGLIQGQQIAGKTAVVGTEASLATQGRSAVLAVNGNMVMGKHSTLMANAVEASKLSAQDMNAEHLSTSALDITGSALRLGQYGMTNKFNLFLRKGTQVRLPRVVPGTQCESHSDVAMSRALIIMPMNVNSVAAMTRFLLYCKPDPATNADRLKFGTSFWSSPDYEALLVKYPPKSYRWHYFDSSPADSDLITHEP